MKFLSRKLLVLVLTGIIDILIVTNIIPIEAKDLILKLINSLAGCYIIVQGIIDLFKKDTN